MTPTLQTDHSSFMIIPVLSQLKWTRFIINPDDNNIAEFKCVCVYVGVSERERDTASCKFEEEQQFHINVMLVERKIN